MKIICNLIIIYNILNTKYINVYIYIYTSSKYYSIYIYIHEINYNYMYILVIACQNASNFHTSRISQSQLSLNSDPWT